LTDYESMNEKQADFALHISQLITWAFRNGYPVIYGEAFRTKEQAEIYAAAGKGIVNSNHCKRLALDLFAMQGGKLTWDWDVYQTLGERWESMHPLARWGGRFRNRDGVHFSFLHNGVA